MLTPFEMAADRSNRFGHMLVQHGTLACLVNTACDYEAEMCKIGHGVPPLDETVYIHEMWADIAQNTVGEA